MYDFNTAVLSILVCCHASYAGKQKLGLFSDYGTFIAPEGSVRLAACNSVGSFAFQMLLQLNCDLLSAGRERSRG